MRKKRLWEKRIPTIAAFLILLVSIWVTGLVVQQGIFYIGKASPEVSPQNLTITNISDTSFAVSFTTNEKAVSAVSVRGDDGYATVVFDDRNKPTGAQEAFFSHKISVPNLKPNTSYSFSILVNSKEFLDNEKPFTTTTGPQITSPPPDYKPLYGKIVLPDSSDGADVLLLVTIPGAQKISAVTKTSGEYIIPINSLRTEALDKYFETKTDTSISIVAIRQNISSTIIVQYEDGKQIPIVNLSQNYSFLEAPTPPQTTTLLPDKQLEIPPLQTQGGEVRIITPQQSQTFTDTRPVFRGTGLSNQKVKITIDSTAQPETSVDASGVWSFRPSAPLSQGEHSFSIETPDRFGIATKIQRKFIIFASGSQVAQTATPSATPTTTPSSTPTPTSVLQPSTSVSPTPSVSITITQAPSTTLTPILTPSPTLTPTATVMPTPTGILPSPKTPTGTLPPSGSSNTTIVLTFVSVLFILTGATLLFFLG